MLSDEEKKAMERIDYIQDFIIENGQYNADVGDMQYFSRVLNLIEKQSKEIEHQKEKRENQRNELAILNAKQIEFNKLVNTVNSYKGQFERQQKEIEELREELNRQINTRTINEEYVEKKCISTKEIKEILGIEENIDNEKLLSLLQTIVDENSRLEDIEDRKVQIEYNNVFNKGVKSVEDKIKAKIEEYKESGSVDGTNDILITEMQSLLEKE